jgi:ABC-2 type transport system permease protein
MNLRRLAALIGKETHELIRDPITLWLALLMPLVMLFLFGYAVTLDVEGVSVGIYDEDRSPASRELVQRFAATQNLSLTRYFESMHEVVDAMQRSQVRLALVIPPDFQQRLITGPQAPVQVLVDGTFSVTAALAAGYAEAIVRSFPAPPASTLNLETRVWYNPSLRSANFVVPGLLAVILMAFPPLLTALAIVREKETGTIQQIYASPVTSAEFVAGKLVPYGAVALIEMLLLIVVGTFWFKVPFAGSPALLVSASLIYVLTTVAIGLLVSTITKTQVAAMLVALIVSLMPSFLFSGFLFPVFTMPFSVQLYSMLIPASYFMEISRGVVLKDADLTTILPNLVVLVLYTLVLFGLASWRLRQKVA